MTSIILVGALGRMGSEITAVAQEGNKYNIVAFVDKGLKSDKTHFSCIKDVPEGIKADVVLDFSHFSSLEDNLSFCKSRSLPIVIGVTGYSDAQKELLHNSAKAQPVFYAPNMSIGIYALRQAAKLLARMLNGFDIELSEIHHTKKLDAPSGTAVQILSDLKTASGLSVSENAVRSSGEIGVHALRGGTVAGVHEVQYFGLHESVSLKHTAESRRVFACGALVACGFMHGKTAKGSIYTMDDCVSR